MNGSSLTTSAGMAENEPSLRHRVSAHATPHDTSATEHRYPNGIRNLPAMHGFDGLAWFARTLAACSG